jgi:hypothetical protein
MFKACGKIGEKTTEYRLLMGKPERRRHGWVDNIEIDLGEMARNVVVWIFPTPLSITCHRASALFLALKTYLSLFSFGFFDDSLINYLISIYIAFFSLYKSCLCSPAFLLSDNIF